MSNVIDATTKCLLHFDELLKDEINLETWTAENANAKLIATPKFGTNSFYAQSALIGTNNTEIWSLNSSADYEIEFFVYPVAHGNSTRRLFSLWPANDNTATPPIFLLSLTTSGCLSFEATDWDITTALTDTTVLTKNTWSHVLLRIKDNTLSIYLNGEGKISSELPDNITLSVAEARIGYFSSTSHKVYIDEFLFKHSAGSGSPVVPVFAYPTRSLFNEHKSGNTKSLLHFETLLKDEINLETWTAENTNAKLIATPKFGTTSFHAQGALIGTNSTEIWSLNSSNNYEIEFFVYPVAHGSSTRRLFSLWPSSNTTTPAILELSLDASGYLVFTATGWDISSKLTGTTVLAITTWHHILLRIKDNTLTIYLNGAEELSSVLPIDVTFSVVQARIGYFSSTSYKVYIDEFLFKHSAGSGLPVVPVFAYPTRSLFNEHKSGNTKSLLHFDELLKDEINLETWTAENANAKLIATPKFGTNSFYAQGALIGTNNTEIWSLNSSADYEIEFFVYPVAHGNSTRRLFSLWPSSNTTTPAILELSLNSSGCIELTAIGWNINDALIGSTVLETETWHHILLRVRNNNLTVYINGSNEISSELPKDITLSVTKTRIGYFSSTSYVFYMDEFVFRHYAGTTAPTIPIYAYPIRSLLNEHKSGTKKSLLHFETLLKDEINLETWTAENANAKLIATPKFGTNSFYAQSALIGTNNTEIWSLNSSADYEIEFFVYPVAHGNSTRRLFSLWPSSNTTTPAILELSLNSGGCIELTAIGWNINDALIGSTVLETETWHHILLRVRNNNLTVYINGSNEISSELPKDITLSVTKTRIGYCSNIDYIFYVDEFLFKHSAGTEASIIPTYAYRGIEPAPKRDFGTIKSLLHFDYPYFNEPNDGLDDEIGLDTWTKSSTNVKLYGTAIPKAGNLAPKFGYRCLYTNKAYIYCNNDSGIWNLSSDGSYEISMFVYVTQIGSEKNIFSLLDYLDDEIISFFDLSLKTDGTLYFSSVTSGDNGFGFGMSGNTIMTVNTWHHVLLRIFNNCLYMYLDGNLEDSSGLQPEREVSVSQVRIGNDITAYPVYIDKFMFKHSADTEAPVVPTQPYNATLDTKRIGGYGNGSDGDVTISANTQINSYATISEVNDSHSFTVSSISTGSIPFAAGREVMIHVTGRKSTDTLLGFYAFAKIKSFDGNSIVLRRNITIANGDDFKLNKSLINTYYVQVITIPYYNSLTINSGRTVTPLSWSSGRGGLVVFRCKGDCTVNGSIITHGRGATRHDKHQMTHSKLIDRFLFAGGGGIFITCGGIFTAPDTARLGATWSGLGDGSNGAAGYGGKGGNAVPSSSKSNTGGAGGVGGGGGGAVSGSSQVILNDAQRNGGAVGSNGISGYAGSGGGGCGGSGGAGTNGPGGGGGGGQGSSGGSGGTGTSNDNGISANGVNGGNGRSNSSNGYCGGAGGGAPGGNGGTGYKYNRTSSQITATGGVSGTSIILICNRLAVEQASLSTGGATASRQEIDSGYSCIGAGGGGGTGFCYIAAGELLNE